MAKNPTSDFINRFTGRQSSPGRLRRTSNETGRLPARARAALRHAETAVERFAAKLRDHMPNALKLAMQKMAGLGEQAGRRRLWTEHDLRGDATPELQSRWLADELGRQAAPGDRATRQARRGLTDRPAQGAADTDQNVQVNVTNEIQIQAKAEIQDPTEAAKKLLPEIDRQVKAATGTGVIEGMKNATRRQRRGGASS